LRQLQTKPLYQHGKKHKSCKFHLLTISTPSHRVHGRARCLFKEIYDCLYITSHTGQPAKHDTLRRAFALMPRVFVARRFVGQ
jgi:hypothetical protein